MFNNNSHYAFLHVGITNHYELSSYGLGGEVKLYGSFLQSTLLSGSIYANYRHLYTTKIVPSNGISLGVHLFIFGMETTCYFDRDNIPLFYLTPKLGFDTGSFSLFYGYSVSLKSWNFQGAKSHNLSLKYHLYLDGFKYHKSRVKTNKVKYKALTL